MKGLTGSETADRILDAAEELVQTRGLNAMSYADIAERVGIRKASLHYHYPAKADLVRALIERYSARFFDALAVLEAETANPSDRLRGYADVYAGVLARGRMCLCGMLASDYQTLSVEAQSDVGRFLSEISIGWKALSPKPDARVARPRAPTARRRRDSRSRAGGSDARLTTAARHRTVPGHRDALVVSATGS